MGLFDAFGSQFGGGGFGGQPGQSFTQNMGIPQVPTGQPAGQPGGFGSGFQPNAPMNPGPMTDLMAGYHPMHQGLFAQMGQQDANGQTGWQNLGQMGKGLQDQPQQAAGPSMLAQGMSALMQQQPQMGHPMAMPSMFQMPYMRGR